MMGEQKNGPAQEQDVKQLLKVRREKLADLQERGMDPFRITKYEVSHHSQEIKDEFESLEGKTVTIAGRMMSKRVMGKASFCNVQDLKGNIQSYRYFAPRLGRSLCMRRRLRFLPRACRFFRRSFTASPTRMCAIVSGTRI